MFPALRDEVASALDAALSARELPTDDLGIEEPPDDVDSVLASSVAFRLAGEVGAAPPQVAAELADEIDVDELRYVDRVETQGPYVNFLPSPTYYAETVEAATADDYGHRPDRDESVVVEHTSANPTGPVHVGRARNPIIGDAVATLLSYAGYDVDRHYYVNDAGRQIAVFTWAYETFDEADLPEPQREKADYELVRYYRKGNAFLEDGPAAEVEAAEAEIESIMQGLEAGDEDAYERVTEVVDQVLGGMRETLARLPAEYDEFVKETRFMQDGSTDDVVSRLQDVDEAFYEDGAWQLDLSAFGMEKPFVFLRADGTSLYTTRDVAHHEWKFEQYDRAVTVIGEDHELTFEELRKALSLLGHDTENLEQLFYSWVNLPGGEGMSTREGTGIDLDDLLDEAIDRAREEVEDRLDDRIRDDDLTEDDIERIARQVGIGAVRYDIVAKQPTKAITFEWDRALDFEAQSAPYVQYVHARCCGILEEAGLDPGNVQDGLATTIDTDALATDAERDLIETIGRFPWEIEEAADDLEPHRIATYTREFAETFNAFYRECPVLADDVDTDTRDARLALVAASKHTMANALNVLGVAPPRSM
ncbi:arginyl-tRNA ligase [Halovivax asiaticus JCM 14624]|uniref:Arginine--tRNA ligase n=1 Tax=Halovivax asiaticus JCM 14624 TaxID=1227490 RepID=M0BIM2_9EURY|nr:arginine--tRNA ligase [Halovivax asiaticus]ELZ09479.1 arginyl-tRNA ligase [Halovivax asiaticus JCM 14624]